MKECEICGSIATQYRWAFESCGIPAHYEHRCEKHADYGTAIPIADLPIVQGEEEK